MTLGELNIWYFLFDELLLVGILVAGLTYFTSKSLFKAQKVIISEIKAYLEKTLLEHRKTATEMVGLEITHNISDQLEQVSKELQQALADKTVAEDAQVIAETAQTVAEDESQAKTDFLSRMSHEIRTPINGIIGSLDLINLEEVNPCLLYTSPSPRD